MMKQLSVCLCLYVCLYATISASQLHCTINYVSSYISTTVSAVTACNFMCILLLLERVYLLLFVFYLIGCKFGVGCPYVCARLYK